MDIADVINKTLHKHTDKKSGASLASITSSHQLIRHCKILDPRGESLEDMQEWPLTVELLRDFFPENKRALILKARQLGVSWSAALYALFHCMKFGFRTVGSVNTTKDEAAKLIFRMKVLWSTLPPSLRVGCRWGTYSATFNNGSRVLSLATNDIGGAGETFSLLLIDEAGLIKNLGENWAALLPAVEYGQLIIFSTPRSATTKFAELINNAISGDSVFKLRKCFYWERPDRDQSTPEGRAWKAARQKELSKREWRREYELEFERGGDCYFDDETLEMLKGLIRKPVDSKRLIYNKLDIWLPPKPGVEYVIGADVAEGFSDGDYSVFHVGEKYTGKIAARYRAHVKTHRYSKDLVHAAKWYNKAWVGVERNNHGHAVCQNMYYVQKYRRMFREERKERGELDHGPTYVLGISTNSASRPAMIGNLEKSIEDGFFQCFDEVTYNELTNFVYNDDGDRYEAAPGCNDDCVLSACVTNSVMKRRRPKAA